MCFYFGCRHHVLEQLTSVDLLKLSRKEKDGRKRMRLLAVSYFLDGLSRTDISTTLKVARSSVNRWVTAYLTKGLSGLDSVSPKGRPSMLSPKQLRQLAQYVENQSCSTEGGRLMGQDFCTFIKEEFDIDYHRDHVYKILKKLGYSWITSCSKHPKQSQSVQDVFKKLPDGNDP